MRSIVAYCNIFDKVKCDSKIYIRVLNDYHQKAKTAPEWKRAFPLTDTIFVLKKFAPTILDNCSFNYTHF